MYKKMLVPLDTSSYAECVLDHVKEIATARNIPEVVLLSVAEPTYVPAGSFLNEQVVKQADEAGVTQATEYLEKAKQSLNLCDSNVSTVVKSGLAADTILDYMEKNGVDLVVMSSHGRSGVSRWYMGSVAEKVVRSSPVPVFLVPSLVCRLKA